MKPANIYNVNQIKTKNGRLVHRIIQIIPCEAGTVLIWFGADTAPWLHSTACFGYALVESYYEDSRDECDRYYGPDWNRSLVPMYQSQEGVIEPANDDQFDGRVLTPKTTTDEVDFWIDQVVSNEDHRRILQQKVADILRSVKR